MYWPVGTDLAVRNKLIIAHATALSFEISSFEDPDTCVNGEVFRRLLGESFARCADEKMVQDVAHLLAYTVALRVVLATVFLCDMRLALLKETRYAASAAVFHDRRSGQLVTIHSATAWKIT